MGAVDDYVVEDVTTHDEDDYPESHLGSFDVDRNAVEEKAGDDAESV